MNIDKQRIEELKRAGYTVHGPSANLDSWTFCIEGEYGNEYESEDDAWQGANLEYLYLAEDESKP